MNFEELDEQTRAMMMRELETELAGPRPYFSKTLSARGRAAFPDLMRNAIRTGTEVSLSADLAHSGFWNPTEEYKRRGVVGTRRVNVHQAAERLAITEFNTWYVRGLAARLLDEGVLVCQAYRAAQPKWEPGECSAHEGQVYPVEEIYKGHRARYWPTKNDAALSIPFGPGCHHTIRRL